MSHRAETDPLFWLCYERSEVSEFSFLTLTFVAAADRAV